MAERMTSILALRVSPSRKEKMKEEAKKRGKSLSDFLWDLIQAGWEKIVEGEDVKQEGKDS